MIALVLGGTRSGKSQGAERLADTLTQPVTFVATATWVASRPDFGVDVDRLCAALTARRGDTVVVSDEVGLGVHPSTATGRRFRDALGEVNRGVAEIADRVMLVVAGRVLALAPAPAALGGSGDPDGPPGPGSPGRHDAGAAGR